MKTSEMTIHFPPATGQHLAASGRYGKIKMIPPVVPIRSLTGMAKWRGSSGFFRCSFAGKVGLYSRGKWSCRHFCGNVFCCLNFNTQRIELYNGSSLIGSYATEIVKTHQQIFAQIQECTPLK